jgi:coatomer subunit beta
VVQILICQNLRNNLQHPNEYIRGVTLRFLCRIREEEILEPLIPSILACLEHRHSYVRRNAVLAINSLYKLPKGELLLVDAPELIEKVRCSLHLIHYKDSTVELVKSVVCPSVETSRDA